jgi:cyclic pyranopterin phosphate synthase
LGKYGVSQFTFKHTYVAYESSLFQGSAEDRWAAEHQVEFDPFAATGETVGRLPWGPCIRRLGDFQVCYYHEPTPQWELTNRLCRSSNLLSDGSVYASLEDQRSLLYHLTPC